MDEANPDTRPHYKLTQGATDHTIQDGIEDDLSDDDTVLDVPLGDAGYDTNSNYNTEYGSSYTAQLYDSKSNMEEDTTIFSHPLPSEIHTTSEPDQHPHQEETTNATTRHHQTAQIQQNAQNSSHQTPQQVTQPTPLIPSQIIQRQPHLQEFGAPPPTGIHPNEATEPANHYIGNTLALPKSPNTTQLYFQNVNGLSLTTPGTWETACLDLQDMEVDLGLIAEHKLDTSQPRVIKRLHDDIKTVFDPGTFCINATSTPIPSQSMFKPGGVLSITQGRLKGRILESGQDPYGRWVYTKFRRNIGLPVTVIATYQVVDTPPQTAGPTTYATQLYASYIAEGCIHPDCLRHHHAVDLVNFVKSCQA